LTAKTDQESPADLLQRVAARATTEGETIHDEPFEVRPDMVADAIGAADALGRDWKQSHGRVRPLSSALA
jgi:glycerol dehydrogenase